MRAIGLVLAAVAFSLTFTTAEAARRDQAPAGRSSASTARAPAATVRPAVSTSRAMARPAIASSPRGTLIRTAYATPSPGGRSVAAQRGGRHASAAAPVCSRSVVRGRTVSRCTASGSGQTRLAWQAGLAPAANIQTSDCPEGTMATLATGHTNVVRCMPI